MKLKNYRITQNLVIIQNNRINKTKIFFDLTMNKHSRIQKILI